MTETFRSLLPMAGVVSMLNLLLWAFLPVIGIAVLVPVMKSYKRRQKNGG